MQIQRQSGWQMRLCQYLSTSARTQFQDGQHDCALFAAGAVAAMTGVDLAEGWRGRYSTIRGGMRVLRKAGYEDHVALAAAHLRERTRQAGDAAQPGDLAVIPTDDGPALGVVQGVQVYVLRRDGLGLVPLSAAIRIFEV